MNPAVDSLCTSILDSLTSGVVAVDLENRVIFVNPALAARIEIDRDACLGKPAVQLFRSVVSGIPPKDTPMYRTDPRRDGGRSLSRDVEWMERGKQVQLREDSSPLRDSSGELAGRLFAYHDLSWEKTVDQMKSEFISVASHELRTPMTSIKGSVDLILSGCTGPVSPEALELLEVAHSACDRMIRLINDLLDLSKIEAGQMQMKLSQVDLREIAEISLRGLKPLAGQDHITLRLEATPEIPPVRADRDRLEQVITNLVSNAIKYSPAKGEVAIQICTQGNWVQCTVADQGCGIEEKDLDRIFGKFQQVGKPVRGGGTGLGLAITQALVAELKGKIWVESQVGKGSRFVFCLPAVSPI
jgi:signal transduction histidine kinase